MAQHLTRALVLAAAGLAYLGAAALAADAPAPAATAPVAAVAPAPAKPVTFALKEGMRVAIVGDSITEQKQYSVFMEMYLTMCMPQLKLRTCQFGWGGERAAGFVGRMENDIAGFKPDVVTTCYGMNDGGYRAFDAGIGKGYEVPMRDIVARLTKAGVAVVVGGPGAVDSKYFVRPGNPDAAKVYNENLNELTTIAKNIAAENGLPFADVHAAMMTSMAAAKKALGDDYSVGGGDGVHPPPAGHLIMAYAFLKAMGLDGNLGTITVDLKGPATADNGHQVLSSQNGKVELESSRYPFCFYGDDKTPNGTRSMLPFVPFNQDLNRLTLIVKNLAAPKAKVTWGTASQEFTREELEKGINLAAAFIDNPFSLPFRKVAEAIAAKQTYETFLIKGVITSQPTVMKNLDGDAEVLKAMDTIRTRLWARQEALTAKAGALFVPVKHTLTVEPVQ